MASPLQKVPRSIADDICASIEYTDQDFRLYRLNDIADYGEVGRATCRRIHRNAPPIFTQMRRIFDSFAAVDFGRYKRAHRKPAENSQC